MREDVQRLPTHFRKEAHAQIDSCISIIQSCAPPNCSKPCKIKPPVANFFAQDAELRAFLSAYLNSDAQIENKDVVLRMCFYWSEFTQALDFVTDEHKEFFTSFVPFPAQIKITCCDASEILKNCYDDYSQVVGFSATLKPFDYYIRLSGLEGCNPKTAEFASPFARSQRKLLIIPQISSKYSERERNYPRIADTIRRIASLRRENYFAFFPSFEFLGRVFEIFQPLEGFEVFRQTSGMHRDAIENVLERLKLVGGANIIFAVQGGVFSEGIDYTGDMAIGAFVVGPPLPNFDLIREEMRRFYQENYQQGFDYAYTYPAMAKAVQAAGRVIRSETDRGLIVLMDSRFTHGSYSKSMPQDWFDKSPLELVSQKILSDIEDFWRQAPEAHDAR